MAAAAPFSDWQGPPGGTPNWADQTNCPVHASGMHCNYNDMSVNVLAPAWL